VSPFVVRDPPLPRRPPAVSHAWSPELDALLAGYAIPGLAPPADLASGWLSLWTTVLDGGCSDPASWNPTTVAWI
jgi:hypothetical protein